MNFLPTDQMLFVYANTHQFDTDMNNYIRTVTWTYYMIADQMERERNYKAMYACNKMAHHYSKMLARLNA